MAVDFDQGGDDEVISDLPEGKSLEASLESAFEALAKGESEPPASGQPREPIAGQPRDQVGRFAPKAAEAAPVEMAPPQPAAPVDDMPRSWGRDKSQIWAAAPPDLRAAIVERENQMAAGVQRFSGLAEYADIAESNGRTLRQAMDSYVQFERLVETNPLAGMEQLSQVYGVKPEQIVAYFSGNRPAQPAAPQMVQDPRIDEVLQYVEAEKRGRIENEVDSFWKDPANKFAEDVGLEMAEEIRKAKALGKPITLQHAYDRAIWTNAQVRDKLLTERAQSEASAKMATAQRVATTSRAAAKSLVPSPAATPAKPKGMSLDQALSVSWDQLAS
jgi:hypothetical protein